MSPVEIRVGREIARNLAARSAVVRNLRSVPIVPFNRQLRLIVMKAVSILLEIQFAPEFKTCLISAVCVVKFNFAG